MGIGSGKSLNGAVEETRLKFWPTMIMNWKVWPIIQFFNFTLIPAHLQAIYVYTASLGWNIYLSHMKGLELPAVTTNGKK